MAIFPKLSQKSQEFIAPVVTALGLVDGGFWALNSADIATVGFPNRLRAFADAATDQFQGYDANVFNGANFVNYNNGGLGDRQSKPTASDGIIICGARIGPSSITDNEWLFGIGNYGAPLSNSTRVLPAFPPFGILTAIDVTFSGRDINGGVNYVVIAAAGTQHILYAIEHNALGSTIYNLATFDTLAETNAMVDTTFDFQLSIAGRAGDTFDYALAYYSAAGPSLIVGNLAAYNSPTTAINYSVTFDDSSIVLGSLYIAAADANYFYYSGLNTMGENIVIRLTATGDNYDLINIGAFSPQTVAGYDNGNKLLLQNNVGDIFSATLATNIVATVGYAAIRDALPLPCYNPCLHYAIKEEF